MKEKNQEIQTTKELFQMIQQSPGRFANGMKSGDDFNRPLTVPQYLEQLLEKYQMSISELITKTLLSKSFVYQIFSGERNPSRDILLRIAFAMHLSIDETQHLFLVGQKGALYPKVRRDAALMCCLEQKLSLDETEILIDLLKSPSAKHWADNMLVRIKKRQPEKNDNYSLICGMIL